MGKFSKSFDLSKHEEPKVTYLKPEQPKTEKGNNKKNKSSQAKSNSDKKGRPMIADEILSEKITLNVSSTEMEEIRNKANGIPLSSFVRKYLKEAKVF